MASQKLIALAGCAGSGKSLAASKLMQLGYIRVKFADPLKAMLRTLYQGRGLEEWQIHARLEGVLKEKPDPYLEGKTPRHAMQTLGTEWGRDAIHKALWVNAAMDRVKRLMSKGEKVVIDDCRFASEAAAVHEAGGIVVMIERDGLFNVPTHQSEELNGLSLDYLIRNDSTISDFLVDVTDMTVAR